MSSPFIIRTDDVYKEMDKELKKSRESRQHIEKKVKNIEHERREIVRLHPIITLFTRRTHAP